MSFNISYVVQAIDGFSVVANKIKRSADGVKRKFQEVRASVRSLSDEMVKVGKRMTLFATTSIGLLGFTIIKAASDAEEARKIRYSIQQYIVERGSGRIKSGFKLRTGED